MSDKGTLPELYRASCSGFSGSASLLAGSDKGTEFCFNCPTIARFSRTPSFRFPLQVGGTVRGLVPLTS